MEATVVLVVFLGVICGGMTLMLAAGFLSVERERAATRAASGQRAAATAAVIQTPAPAFFIAAGVPAPAALFEFDEALVRRLEHHVRLEQAMVAQFVHHPSVDNLYRQPGAALRAH